MEKLFLSLLVLTFLIPVNVVRSQDEYKLQIIKEQLNKSDLKKIEKAEKHLSVANDQMNEAKTYESSGKSKNKALNKKIGAATDFGSAHKIIYDVYIENIEKLSKITSTENVQKANKSIEADYKLVKDAKKKRETSLRINVLEKAYEELEDACSMEKEAIRDLAGVFVLLSGKNSTVSNKEIVKTDKTTTVDNTKKAPVEVKKEDIPIKNENKSTNIENTKINETIKPSISEDEQYELNQKQKEQEKKGVFFKIQIAASKTPLSVEQLNTVYKTSEMFNVEKDGEWYKYSVIQKFYNYDEAIAYKGNLKIKGSFIIAYKEGKRVSVDEALKKEDEKKAIVENNAIDPVKKEINESGKTIFRLQIGISTLRMSDKEIAEFKNAGNPVLTIDHGGWFSYNVGEFNSELEAQKFKKAKGMVDASVVKFVNGELIE